MTPKAVVHWIVSRYYRWQVKRGIRLLESFDDLMTAAGFKRHERRQFWREFTAKREARERLYERIAR